VLLLVVQIDLSAKSEDFEKQKRRMERSCW